MEIENTLWCVGGLLDNIFFWVSMRFNATFQYIWVYLKHNFAFLDISNTEMIYICIYIYNTIYIYKAIYYTIIEYGLKVKPSILWLQIVFWQPAGMMVMVLVVIVVRARNYNLERLSCEIVIIVASTSEIYWIWTEGKTVHLMTTNHPFGRLQRWWLMCAVERRWSAAGAPHPAVQRHVPSAASCSISWHVLSRHETPYVIEFGQNPI